MDNIPEFKTKAELYSHLRENKADLMSMKKKAIKLCDGVGTPSAFGSVKKSNEGANGSDTGIITRTIIGNTYNWMDSHGDVHVGNTFKKSINESKDIFHLHDHEFKLTAKVGDFKKIEEKQVAWRELNVNKDGTTTILTGTSEIKRDYNSYIYKEYKKGAINQHSVGMWYLKIALAVNSDNDADKAEKAEWDKYFPLLGNPELAEAKGYFWAVKEAKLSEISAVLLGSNELTGMYDKHEPSLGTHKSKDTHIEPSINYQYLINNLK